MALKYPDRIESNNPQAYGIVKATEVSGAKNAAEYGGLLSIPDNILSANGDGSDALYLLWIDDNSVYRLVDWNNRHNSKGWQIEYAHIPWNNTAHLNSLTLSGQYYISGQSNGLNGGLPILNSNPGHTFDAVLRVLDSSLTKDENEKLLCITQILSLSNRMGGDGHIFVRTIQTLEKDNLTRTDIESPACNKWSSWEKLLGIIEKNVVELPVHLNTYTTNGMYSGVFANPDTVGGLRINALDTFLLITVNGYAAASVALLMGLKKVPQLTQLLYITPIETGLANLYTRTATWHGSLWGFGNFYRMATSEDINSIRTLALYQFNIVPTKDNVKFVISNLDDFVVGEVNMLQASTTLAGVMSAEDKIKLDSVERTANNAKSAAETAQTAADTAQGTANSALGTATAASTAAQEAKSAAETAKSELKAELNGKQDALTLTVKDNGNIVLANIQGQSKEFMPATPSGDPMHYAYVTAGAEYNDTGADIVKDAPWAYMLDDDYDGPYGKTVVHKAGYWYLNGLGDITNEEIRKIYIASSNFPEADMRSYFGYADFRTNFSGIRKISGWLVINAIAISDGSSKFSILNLSCLKGASINMPSLNNQIVHILGTEVVLGNVQNLSSDKNLITAPFKKLMYNLNIGGSTVLSVKSVLYMINNEKATSPITITLHADVYNRCMANEDILAALEAHTNISLASAQ